MISYKLIELLYVWFHFYRYRIESGMFADFASKIDSNFFR